MVKSVIHITDTQGTVFKNQSGKPTITIYQASIKNLAMGSKVNRRRRHGPPRSLPSHAGAELTEIPDAKWSTQAPSKDARRQAVVNGRERGMDPACRESRKGWQLVKTGKSGKTSHRRQSWSVLKGEDWYGTISLRQTLKGHPPKGKGGWVLWALGRNQRWEFNWGFEN